MSDSFGSFRDALAAPSRVPYAIIPSDTEALRRVTKGIYVGTGGDVTRRGVDSDGDVTYRNLPDASFINVRASFVRATGTTAADLIGEA